MRRPPTRPKAMSSTSSARSAAAEQSPRVSPSTEASTLMLWPASSDWPAWSFRQTPRPATTWAASASTTYRRRPRLFRRQLPPLSWVLVSSAAPGCGGGARQRNDRRQEAGFQVVSRAQRQEGSLDAAPLLLG